MIRTKIKQNSKLLFCIIICVVSGVLLISFPKFCADGARKGITLCKDIIVPSLFPFLVLSSFATLSGTVDFLGRKTNRFFRKFFGLSGQSGAVVIFSLFAGFPVGASMASELFSQNKITKTEAERITLSCVNAGPAFVIGAVGSALLSSFKAGVLIFISLSLSSILIAYLSKFIFQEDFSNERKSISKVSVSQALVNSVYNASKSMFSICGWIVLFSSFVNIISAGNQNESFIITATAFLEVCSGSVALAQKGNPIILTALLGWGGLCVHAQIFPSVLKSGIKAKSFFCFRILNCAFSSIICYFLFSLFPCEVSVFSQGIIAVSKTFAVSAPAAAGLVLMCAILILDLDIGEKV